MTSAGVTSHLITYSTWKGEKKNKVDNKKKDRLNNEAQQGLLTQVDRHHGDRKPIEIDRCPHDM